MSVIGNNILAGASGQDGGYVIDRSLRFRRSASAYLNRTPSSATNRTTWTWSAWVKLGQLGVNRQLFGAANTTESNEFWFRLESNNTLAIQQTVGGSASGQISASTTAVFRDPSAWYHLVLAIDTTQGTSTNRAKLYVNSVQQTWGSYTVNSVNTWVNNNSIHTIGLDATPNTNYLDGYLTEVNFIDGQALTPDNFGEFDAITGVWKPKRFAGTYGTNGFYLDFKDPTSTTTLTADQSGNGNNWTANNISLTSGATYDSMIDTPTPVEDERGNFAVLNPLSKNSSTSIANGNLSASGNVIFGHTQATMFVNSGKWYFEAQLTTQQNDTALGLGNIASNPFGQFTGGDTNSVGYLSDGRFFYNGSAIATYSSYTTTDVVACAFDCATGKIWIAKNNTWQNSGNPAAGTGQVQTVSWTEFAALARTVGSGAIAFNFGQRPFAYTPPSGFKALHTGNLPEPAIVDGSQYFAATTYTGNGTTNNIVNSGGMQPDLVWVKVRSQADQNVLCDSVRGVARRLFSNLTNAEEATGGLVSINANGFTLASTSASMNNLGQTYVAWNWRASNAAAVTNTAGSITSTVSANPTAGFSIVKWNGSGNATIGHGLGVAPSMYIVKLLDQTSQWYVYFRALGTGSYMQLNLTASATSDLAIWQNTAPTSTVFSIGAGINANNMIAYCFAEVPGFSRFGSYTGNGSADGPFVFCGFRPAFVMIKRTDSTQNWPIVDAARDTYNIANKRLFANLSDSEDTGIPNYLDLLSNGFKCRDSNVSYNASGGTYIYMAFAESPFKTSLAR